MNRFNWNNTEGGKVKYFLQEICISKLQFLINFLEDEYDHKDISYF
jgi:hypothetical protein